MLIVRANIDSVLTLLDNTLTATAGDGTTMSTLTRDIALSIRAGAQTVTACLDPATGSMAQFSNSAGLRAAELLLHLGTKTA
eukprot:3469639-Amphidinium_carterae.1